MGFEELRSGKKRLWGIQSLLRRKQVDSDRVRRQEGGHQLAKELSVLQLVAIGIGNFESSSLSRSWLLVGVL